MESNGNKTTGKIIYTLLTFTAVVILFVTLYTFFGAANREEDHKTTPDTSDGITTDSFLPPDEITPGINAPISDNGGTGGQVHKPEEAPDTTGAAETSTLPEAEKPHVDVSSDSGDTSNNDEPSLGQRKLTSPLKGTVTKGHDTEKAVFSVTMNDYRVHCGIDIEGNLGDNVVACGGGVISNVENDPFMGTCVTVDLGGELTARYCNLSPELPEDITVGASVDDGQIIGTVGESAIIEIGESPHLHFELSYRGEQIDPLSVLEYNPEVAFEDGE